MAMGTSLIHIKNPGHLVRVWFFVHTLLVTYRAGSRKNTIDLVPFEDIHPSLNFMQR